MRRSGFVVMTVGAMIVLGGASAIGERLDQPVGGTSPTADERPVTSDEEAVLPTALDGPGSSSSDPILATANSLPVIPGVTEVERVRADWCSVDTCLNGSDRRGELLTFAVDTSIHTQQELIDQFTAGLSDWDADVSVQCGSALGTPCVDQVFATYGRDGQHIWISLDNWSHGSIYVSIVAIE